LEDLYNKLVIFTQIQAVLLANFFKMEFCRQVYTVIANRTSDSYFFFFVYFTDLL